MQHTSCRQSGHARGQTRVAHVPPPGGSLPLLKCQCVTIQCAAARATSLRPSTWESRGPRGFPRTGGPVRRTCAAQTGLHRAVSSPHRRVGGIGDLLEKQHHHCRSARARRARARAPVRAPADSPDGTRVGPHAGRQCNVPKQEKTKGNSGGSEPCKKGASASLVRVEGPFIWARWSAARVLTSF